MPTDLKPCPFCGGKAHESNGWVSCAYGCASLSIDDWNRRHPIAMDNRPYTMAQNALAAIAIPGLSADLLRARDAMVLRDAATSFHCASLIGVRNSVPMSSSDLAGCLFATAALREMADELEQKNG